MRILWRTLKGVLGDHSGEDVSVHTLDDFATFFKDKVESVRLSNFYHAVIRCSTKDSADVR